MSIAEFEQIPETALAWYLDGRSAALATVVETWGSAPRPVGSQLAISADAELVGSVSGGCVEGAVVAEAIEAMQNGVSRILEYGVTDDDAFSVGLACGGRIKVMVEPVSVGDGIALDLLEGVVAARAARRAVGIETDTTVWTRRLVGPEAHIARFAADKAGFEGQSFVTLYSPPLRMIVVGGVHIAQPLMAMARLGGYDAVLVDPREAFATAARFPGERLLHEWPDAALANEGLDARTAIITLTHDPKLDDPAIEMALRTPVFYLGCLGSLRTHAKRVTRLQERGYTMAEIERIDAPIGADIGARSPAEIAISVMAQLTERLRRPETRR